MTIELDMSHPEQFEAVAQAAFERIRIPCQDAAVIAFFAPATPGSGIDSQDHQDCKYGKYESRQEPP